MIKDDIVSMIEIKMLIYSVYIKIWPYLHMIAEVANERLGFLSYFDAIFENFIGSEEHISSLSNFEWMT